jgi:PilZ domain
MRERRKNFRVEWNSSARIYDLDGLFDRKCIVSNFSNGGARIMGLKPDSVPDAFILRISPNCRAQKCHVIWRTSDALGVEFTDSAKDVSELGRRRRSALILGERHPQLV